MARQLIVCADDFAMSAPVSHAIVALARQGALSATSAMVLSPRWASDARELKHLSGQMDVGLHLDWTSTFAHQAGHGQALLSIMARAATGAWQNSQLREVIERQLDAFEHTWHAPPDHIDGHQHVHQMNGIRQVLLKVLDRRYPQQRPWVRVSLTPPAWRSPKSAIVNAWGGRPLRQHLARTGWPMAPWLVGMYDFSDEPLPYPERMRHWLQHAPDGSVLMCHPALPPTDPTDPIGPARVNEYAYLSAPDFAQDLAQTQVTLVRGHQTCIPHHPHAPH